jgi:ParB family chromosome partitioning protein
MSEPGSTDAPVPTPGEASSPAPSGEGASAPEPAVERAAEAVTPSAGLPAAEPAVELEVQPHDVPQHFSAPAHVALDRVDDDRTFLIRAADELDDVSELATDIARLGQLYPVDLRLMPPDRFQILSGFRRVAALRFLQRERVLARLHTDLSDDDAMLMALASAIHVKEVGREALEAVRARLEEAGRLTPAARDMLEKALAEGDTLAPEDAEEEVDAEELAADVTVRLGAINQDLSLLADVFSELDKDRRDELLTQLRYSAELVGFLEGKT